MEDVPCPRCGNKTLEIETRLKAQPVGTYSLAGQSLKVSAVQRYWLVCRTCGIEAEES